jgi:hypothetical protein
MLLVDLGTTGSTQFIELGIVRLILGGRAGVANQAISGRGGSHHSSLIR